MSETSSWLGVVASGGGWELPVAEGVMSGASALFGGCATAAAVEVAATQVSQPVVWVAAHFGSLAKLGSVVALAVRPIATGRTMSHLEVTATADGRESFTARVTAGERPPHDVQGHWVTPPDVTDLDAAPPFDHPVHAGTWAARFDWRLAGRGDDPRGPWAAWWVRSLEPIDPLTEAAVLCDYVTYGVGRALGAPMGGLSIDNVLRVHNAAAAAPGGWRLLEVRPESVAGGFGFGTARLFSDDALIASGSQSIVANTWDWRLPSDGDEAGGALT